MAVVKYCHKNTSSKKCVPLIFVCSVFTTENFVFNWLCPAAQQISNHFCLQLGRKSHKEKRKITEICREQSKDASMVLTFPVTKEKTSNIIKELQWWLDDHCYYLQTLVTCHRPVQFYSGRSSQETCKLSVTKDPYSNWTEDVFMQG